MPPIFFAKIFFLCQEMAKVKVKFVIMLNKRSCTFIREYIDQLGLLRRLLSSSESIAQTHHILVSKIHRSILH